MKTANNTTEGEIRGITTPNQEICRDIVDKWVRGAGPKEIADKTGQSVKVILQVLKEAQKAIIEGDIDHGKNNKT